MVYSNSVFTGLLVFPIIAAVITLPYALMEVNDNFVFLPFIMVAVELFILIRIILLIRKERRGTKYTEPFSLRRNAAE